MSVEEWTEHGREERRRGDARNGWNHGWIDVRGSADRFPLALVSSDLSVGFPLLRAEASPPLLVQVAEVDEEA